MSPMTMLEEMGWWLETLPPEFAFLLAMPALVVLAAFAAEAVRRGGRSRGVSRRPAARRAARAGPSLRDRHRPA